MAKLTVGFIGTGRKWDPGKTTGFGMNYAHADGYRALPDMELVACADIKEDLAKAFAAETGAAKVYTDYRKMLAENKLDVVSISTWPHLHEEMVVAACEAGAKIVHCEKPIAHTWGSCKAMAAAAQKYKVRLSFNHQRRFGGTFLPVKKIRDSGRLGKLVRMTATPPNLYDWGTHWVDMMQVMNGESPGKSVLAALHCEKGRKVFDVPHEEQSMAFIQYENGVTGMLLCNLVKDAPNLTFEGEKEVLEVRMGQDLKIRKAGSADYETVPVEEKQDGHVGRAIAEVINSYRENRPCELSVENAIKGTEIIFAAYESVRRRARVDLPISIEDHPLAAMIAEGVVGPNRK